MLAASTANVGGSLRRVVVSNADFLAVEAEGIAVHKAGVAVGGAGLLDGVSGERRCEDQEKADNCARAPSESLPKNVRDICLVGTTGAMSPERVNFQLSLIVNLESPIFCH